MGGALLLCLPVDLVCDLCGGPDFTVTARCIFLERSVLATAQFQRGAISLWAPTLGAVRAPCEIASPAGPSILPTPRGRATSAPPSLAARRAPRPWPRRTCGRRPRSARRRRFAPGPRRIQLADAASPRPVHGRSALTSCGDLLHSVAARLRLAYRGPDLVVEATEIRVVLLCNARDREVPAA